MGILDKIKIKMLDQCMNIIYSDSQSQFAQMVLGKGYLIYLAECSLGVENSNVFYQIIRFKLAMILPSRNVLFYKKLRALIDLKLKTYHGNVALCAVRSL